jgi:hypothetical protein
MKKQFLFFTLFLVLQHVAFSQVEFAPVGATWYINSIPFIMTLPPFPKPLEVKCRARYSNLQGDSIKVLGGGGLYEGDSTLYRQHGDKIYYASWRNGYNFDFLLYDFGAKVGDVMDIYFNENTHGRVVIDSIYQVTILGIKRRAQKIHLEPYNPDLMGIRILWGNTNIEGIGNNFYPSPLPTCCEILVGGLRCFESNEKIHSWLPVGQKCESLVADNDLTQLDKVIVSPNPTTGILNIALDLPSNTKSQFLLYTLQGRLVMNHSFQPQIAETSLELSTLADGLYLWEIRLDNGLKKQGKIVVAKE